MTKLSQALGAEPPPGVAALPEQERDELATLVADALATQSRDLAAAFQATLKHVPFPVRGIAKKMLLG